MDRDSEESLRYLIAVAAEKYANNCFSPRPNSTTSRKVASFKESCRLDFISGAEFVINALGSDTPHLIEPVSVQDTENRHLEIFTCNSCKKKYSCKYAYDSYNQGGDCLAESAELAWR